MDGDIPAQPILHRHILYEEDMKALPGALLRFRRGGPPLITQLLRRHDSGKGVVTAGLPRAGAGKQGRRQRPIFRRYDWALYGSSTPFRNDQDDSFSFVVLRFLRWVPQCPAALHAG